MSQSSLTDDTNPYALPGVQRTLATARALPLHAFDRLRQTVLPTSDAALIDPHFHASAHPRSASHWRQFAILLPRCAMALVAIVLIVAVGLLIFRERYEGRIYPAVAVGDIDVGGLTMAQAEDRLTQRASELEQGHLTFTYGDQTWTPALAELGASVDLETSLASAHDLGRTGDAASRLAFTGSILDTNQAVPLRMELDRAALDAWFDTVDQQLGQPAVNARLVIDGTSVSITDESTGLAVDRTAATDRILAALSSLTPVASELPVTVATPEFTRANLAPVAATVTEMIAKPVEVTFEDQSWTLDSTILGPYLVMDIVMANGAPTAELQLDTEGLASVLREQFGPEVNRSPVDAIIGWDDGVVALEPSVRGVTLKAGAFAEAVGASFLNGHTPVAIPVVVTSPEVDGENLEALGITTLLGQGTSNYSQNNVPGRDANVEVAAELMNGTLVPPGGIFSFNDAIGEITYERGFQESLVVQGDGVGRDVGGGVCQVSTTIFRAALNAGMPITEWYAHTYRLPNYELDGWGAGFDASILQWGPDPAAWPDFEFENYTDGWLLVQSYTSYPQVFVNIYGTGDGRSVVIDAWDLGNNAFAFSRVIHDAQGNVIAERTFESYYK